ncbi:TIR domain-containing protein [Nocardia takedensis]|uniref:TIR domain-containing protein n=1 Tax=Nocardia takedensis TaxID=259390 RepID=UPI0012F6B3D1|nr:TIR domain-containing protein [Nocardia takedensis]
MIIKPSGFWSYVRNDDSDSNGHITRISERVISEFRMQTGSELEIFLDRKKIEWGDAWNEKIDTSIHGTTFFIPIITPSYLQSQACREEFLKFWSKSKSSNLHELILPIIYTEVTLDPMSDDEIIRILSGLQHEDWTELRLEDENSSAYRRGVNRLATRLKKVALSIADQPESTPVLTPVIEDANPTKNVEQVAEDELGWLEQIADAEVALEGWGAAAEDFRNAMLEIGNTFQSDEYRTPPNASNAVRIIHLKRVSKALDGPTQRLLDSAGNFGARAAVISDAIDAASQIAMVSTAGDREKALEMADDIEEIITSIRENVKIDEEFENTLRLAGKMSRDMREPSRRIRTSILTILDTATIMQQWVDKLRSVTAEFDSEDFVSG